MQVYDQYIYYFIYIFQMLNNVVSYEDESSYLFGNVEDYPYLALS